MLLLYLYINIPVSFLYISRIFNALNLLKKPFLGARYGLLEIVLKARFCNLCTLSKHVYRYPIEASHNLSMAILMYNTIYTVLVQAKII